MSDVLAYLDCGCAIMRDGGRRQWCPTCADGGARAAAPSPRPVLSVMPDGLIVVRDDATEDEINRALLRVRQFEGAAPASEADGVDEITLGGEVWVRKASSGERVTDAYRPGPLRLAFVRGWRVGIKGLVAGELMTQDDAMMRAKLAYPDTPVTEPRMTSSGQRPCVWSQDEDGAWETTCGRRWEFNVGTPTENNCRFCMYCGNPLTDTNGPAAALSEETADWQRDLREAWEEWMVTDEAPDADAASDAFARLATAIQDAYSMNAGTPLSGLRNGDQGNGN